MRRGHEGAAAPELLPVGFRTAIVSAIVCVLGFLLLLLRFIALEPGSGPWTWFQVAGFLVGTAAAVVTCHTLWRALQPEDEQVPVYRRTLRWFRAGIVLLLATFLVFVIGSLEGVSLS